MVIFYVTDSLVRLQYNALRTTKTQRSCVKSYTYTIISPNLITCYLPLTVRLHHLHDTDDDDTHVNLPAGRTCKEDVPSIRHCDNKATNQRLLSNMRMEFNSDFWGGSTTFLRDSDKYTQKGREYQHTWPWLCLYVQDPDTNTLRSTYYREHDTSQNLKEKTF